MSSWNIDETPYPGPAVADDDSGQIFITNYFAHGPAALPKVGQFFFNNKGQCLGYVIDYDPVSGVITLQTQGSFP